MKRITQNEYASLVMSEYNTLEVTPKMAKLISTRNEVMIPSGTISVENRIGKGLYKIPGVVEELVNTTKKVFTGAPAMKSVSSTHTINFYHKPRKDFVPWGEFSDIVKVLKSNQFFPIKLVGEKGTGKTLFSREAAAKAGKEIIRLNVTSQTDEEALLGGFRLVNGNTVFEKGPAVVAMERGAILLLDELDRLTEKGESTLMSILDEGYVYLKRINEDVYASPGFTVMATMNTKGVGDGDIRYVNTTTLNEAFNDRFPLTFSIKYPGEATEKKILIKNAEMLGVKDEKVIDDLVNFAGIVRKTFNDGGIDEVVSTRQLVDIYKAFTIFGNINKAVEKSIERYEDEIIDGFSELWTLISSGEKPEEDINSDSDSDSL